MTVFICKESCIEKAKSLACDGARHVSEVMSLNGCPARSFYFKLAGSELYGARYWLRKAREAPRMTKVEGGSKRLEVILSLVQSRVKVRTVSVEGLVAACARAEDDLDWAGLPKSERAGARLLLAVGADEKVATSYRGEFAGTRLTLLRRPAGWYVIDADRGEVRGFQQRLVFAESQMPIIQKKMMERAAELSRGL